MKVLQVIDKLDVGGAERVLVDLSNLLFENGIKVSVLCILDEGVLNQDLNPGINTYFLRRKFRFDFSAFRKLHEIIKNFDILHIHGRHNLRYVGLLSLATGYKGKLIFHDHYGRIDIDKSISYFTKFCLKYIQFYIGVNSALCKWAIDTVRLDSDKVIGLKNISRVFKGGDPDLETKPNAILMVGNFREIKNYEFAIDLMSAIGPQLPLVELHIYGQVVDEVYYKRLLNKVGGLNRPDQVKFFPNPKNAREIMNHYSFAIHTAKSETGPLVLIEYLSVGIPFIAFETGEVAKDLKQHLPVFFKDNFDIIEWCDTLLKIKSMDKSMLKQKEINLFKELYSEDKYVNECIQLYQRSQTY